MKGILSKDINETAKFFSTAEISFKEFLLENLGLSDLYFESTFFFSNLHCSMNGRHQWAKGSEVLISVYQKIFIAQNVNRSMVEEKLVSLPTAEFNISDEVFMIYYDEASFNVPSLISKSRFTDKCFLKEAEKIGDSELYIHSHVNKLLLCKQIELKDDEFKIDEKNLKLTIVSSGFEINHDEYILTSSSNARICFNKFKMAHTRKFDNNPIDVWVVIQLVCTCVSLVCLFLTFITYCLFPSLRSLPGKNNMSLVFAMFFAHFIFQFLVYGSRFETACKIIGILIHYFWLATFGCLSICSFHMYRVFKSKTGMNLSERSKLIIYVLYSYGTPVIIVGLNIVITASSTDDSSIGYGGHVCFLNQPIAFIVTFITPISLVCCSNIVFFIITSFKIATRPKLKTDIKMQSNQIHFTVYVKLFTITGISWIFQIIDAFIPMSAFSKIVSLLNALQGVFIFISYICNKRVLGLYRNGRSSVYENNRISSMSRNRTMTTQFNSKSE